MNTKDEIYRVVCWQCGGTMAQWAEWSDNPGDHMVYDQCPTCWIESMVAE